MKNILSEYLEQRFTKPKAPNIVPNKTGGPVVTISRAYGCPAKNLASMLTDQLNAMVPKSNESKKWQWVGKEIMEDSARELHLNNKFITSIADAEKIGILNDILLTLSNKYYPGDMKIKKTIGEIVKSYANRGHIIIVGRGGVSICQEFKNALHIKLIAPIEWRINYLSKKHRISTDEAEKQIKEIDHKREKMRDFYVGTKTDDTIFDIIFNYYSCSEEEITKTIISMLQYRHLM